MALSYSAPFILISSYFNPDDPRGSKIKLVMANRTVSSDRASSDFAALVASLSDYPGFGDWQKELERDYRMESIRRARATVFELGLCNPWTFFATLTLDPRRGDRSDIDGFQKQFHEFYHRCQKKYKRRYGADELKYLIVPELHADHENWHMHGLFYGLPPEELHRLVIGDPMNANLVAKVAKGETVLRWTDYERAFGFSEFEPIGSKSACVGYVRKYMVKNLDVAEYVRFRHLVFHSQGLKRAERLKLFRCGEECPAPDEMIEFIKLNPKTVTVDVMQNGSQYAYVLWVDGQDRRTLATLLQSLGERGIELKQVK